MSSGLFASHTLNAARVTKEFDKETTYPHYVFIFSYSIIILIMTFIEYYYRSFPVELLISKDRSRRATKSSA